MDYISLYTDFLKDHANLKKPMTIVCDCSNGATGKILQDLLPKLGLKGFTLINDTPDPEFPAHGPNPLLPNALHQLSKTVVEKRADFGIAFDADGDRAFFVDERGTELQSFVIAALLFKYSQPPFVADELVYQAHRHMKLFEKNELHPSRVGVFFIKQVMKEMQALSGAEFSGHFYFRDFFGADSGIFTLIRVLSILSNMEESLSRFAHGLPRHIVKNDDIKIEGKNWKEIEDKIINTYVNAGHMIERREGITLKMDHHGWINIRPSNTEPIVRIYAGADSDLEASNLIKEIKALV